MIASLTSLAQKQEGLLSIICWTFNLSNSSKKKKSINVWLQQWKLLWTLEVDLLTTKCCFREAEPDEMVKGMQLEQSLQHFHQSISLSYETPHQEQPKTKSSFEKEKYCPCTCKYWKCCFKSYINLVWSQYVLNLNLSSQVSLKFYCSLGIFTNTAIEWT